MVTVVDEKISKEDEEVKREFLKYYHDCQPLYSVIQNCIRQTKIFMVIAAAAEHENIQNNSFFGWLQQHLAGHSMIIDVTKLAENTMKFLNKMFELDTEVKSKYANELRELRKNSNINHEVKKLGKIAVKIKNFRNKRVAHLEFLFTDSPGFSYHIGELYDQLCNLDASLSCIRHFLLNPKYIFEQDWSFCKIDYDARKNENDNFFKENDPTMKALNSIIEKLKT